jgi:hypothetical protein
VFDEAFDAAHEAGENAAAAFGAGVEHVAQEPHCPGDRRSGERFDQVFGEGRECGCLCHGAHCKAPAERSD